MVTVSGSVTAAETSRPCAVIAESDPNTRPDDPGLLLSDQACASSPTGPLAVATGVRGVHNFRRAVCGTLGSAPEASTIRRSELGSTQAVTVMPPPCSQNSPR